MNANVDSSSLSPRFIANFGSVSVRRQSLALPFSAQFASDLVCIACSFVSFSVCLPSCCLLSLSYFSFLYFFLISSQCYICSHFFHSSYPPTLLSHCSLHLSPSPVLFPSFSPLVVVACQTQRKTGAVESLGALKQLVRAIKLLSFYITSTPVSETGK